jgi:hypothetical protein
VIEISEGKRYDALVIAQTEEKVEVVERRWIGGSDEAPLSVDGEGLV